jgi:NitT/TauT family transport system ATP-binding protein
MRRNKMENILEVKNIGKKYQNKEGEILALKNVNFRVKKGEFVSIIGPSGCGKSTLLSIIAGLEEKTTGEIYIEGEKVNGISSKIGYMLQRDCLLEWRNILSNTMFGLEVKGKKDNVNKEYVLELLKKYNLYEFKDKYPSELSGGMRQRVALIRTLAVKPKILLLDEAFSALDYQTRIMVTNDIYYILRKEKITAIIVTHDISEAISMSDRVLVLSKRPGTIKDIHKINFGIENRTPINCRESPKFSQYFNTLWKELGVDE